jgi:TolB-like protein
MNTTKVTDRLERKKLKRVARKKAAPKPKRAAGVARGSNKQKVKVIVKGKVRR